jgi:hypothetical protein
MQVLYAVLTIQIYHTRNSCAEIDLYILVDRKDYIAMDAYATYSRLFLYYALKVYNISRQKNLINLYIHLIEAVADLGWLPEYT